jgi:anti-anti-sigma regulatory factor
MKIAIEDRWRFIVYTLAGEIDDRGADKFQKRARFDLDQKELTRPRGFDLILDLAGVTAISPAGVKKLARLRRDLESRGV